MPARRGLTARARASAGATAALAVWAASPARADDAACPAAAIVTGDPTLVDPLAAVLLGRGVTSASPAGCDPTRAEVARRGEQLVVTIIDASGRRSQRTLANLSAAATLIDSWARQDLNAALLAGWTEATAAPASETAPASPQARPGAEPALGADVAVEAALDDDSRTWLGGRVALCARLGPACVGPLGRVATHEGLRVLEAHAAVELVVRRAPRWALTAGLAGGLGWLREERATDAGGVQIGTARTVRGEASLAAAVALAPRLWLRAQVAVSAAGEAPPATMDGQVPTTESTRYLRAALALRWGRP